MLNELRNKELRMVEMFSFSAKIFRENLVPILFITILVFFPISIVLNIVTTQIDQSLSVLHGATVVNGTGLMMKNEITKLIIYLLVMMILFVFLEPLGIISVAKGAEKRICGEDVHYGEIILYALSKGPSIILTGILYTFFVGLASILFFPAIYLGIIWGFYVYAIGLRDKSGLDALRYSRNLVRGRWWLTFGIFLVLGLLTSAFTYGIDVICMAGSGMFFMDVLSSVLVYIIQAFVMTFMTVWFINREYLIENDGFNGCMQAVCKGRSESPWKDWNDEEKKNFFDLEQDGLNEKEKPKQDDQSDDKSQF